MPRKGNPFKGNALNRLSHFNARPVNRDALRIVEPSDPRKKGKESRSKEVARGRIERADRQPKLIEEKRQLVKKDGTVLGIVGRKP